MGIEILALLGFVLAAYAVVANDAIQTLGTFLGSNSHRPWWIIWLYGASILVAVMLYGYYTGATDIAFGRLNRIPFPETGIQWWHVVPPIALVILTRYGIPVSTTFLVLTLFAITGGASTEGLMEKLLLKSGMGYVVAFAVGGLIYLAVARMYENYLERTKDKQVNPLWHVAQWGATAFLWANWLMQDLANIFVYLPRTTTIMEDGSVQVSFSPQMLIFATAVVLVLLAYIFWRRGGKIQKIVLRKTHTTDVRAGTVIDLMFGIILFFFKEVNDIPMSTTWVFLGLLGGRELAIAYMTELKTWKKARRDVFADMGRAFFGLIISIGLAMLLPFIATGDFPVF